MSSALFSGVDHVGVGVSDLDEGIAFYGRVGFSDVLFDWTGEVPGTDALTGGARRRARVAMLANPGATLGTTAFGVISSAGDPRVVQLAAKLLF